MKSIAIVMFTSILLAALIIPAMSQRKPTKPGSRTMLFAALCDIIWFSTSDNAQSLVNYNRQQKYLISQFPEIGLSHFKIYPGDRTYFCAVSESLKELVVVWRGTQMKSADDLLNDGQIALGFEPKRVNFAVQQTKALMAKFPGYRATITGYSLGGTVAEEAAAKIGGSIRGVSFNSGTSPLRPSRPAANVKSYHIAGDIISSFPTSGTPRRVRLENTMEKAHDIRNFHNHFRRGTLPDRRRLI